MKRITAILLFACCFMILTGTVNSRDIESRKKVPYREWTNSEFPQLTNPGQQRYMSAQVDTYCIAWYDFEAADWQGWTIEDRSAQDTFCHVDDFSGLGGGDFGGLLPLEGVQSMWCGARPGTDDFMCSWIDAPGYANDWNQMLVTDAFSFTGLLSFSYHGYFDSEADYDITYVEYDAGAGHWQELATYDGRIDTIANHELLLPLAQTKLRFHFMADSYWSDQDGLWDTDGAFIVDSLRIVDLVHTVNYEDFEDADFGDKHVGIWHGDVVEPYGNYAGMANNLTDKDPCGTNFATQVVFFVGSPYPSSSYPGLFDTPFCAGAGGITAPCQNERIVSPVLDLTMYSSNCDENQDASIPPATLPGLGGSILRFTVYRDIPLDNLVLYIWGVRSIDDAGCPGVWMNDGYVYYGPDMDYIQQEMDVSELITEDEMQIEIGCIDYCNDWYLLYGNCAAHTASPWIDNVRFYRYETSGPQWDAQNWNLFQDNFPEDEFDMESYVRADGSGDWAGPDEPIEMPDMIFLYCTSPLAGGLAADPSGLAKIYMHVRCTYIGDPASPKPPLAGPSLQGTYGHYVSDDGVWTIFQGDSLYFVGGSGILDDEYMWDLNDSLFTRGYQIDYYFKAEDLDGNTSTLPTRAETENQFYEFTCLPTLASDILYVDDFHGRGSFDGIVQNYLDQSFQAVLPPENQPDRYDVNNPSSAVDNGPGSRAKNFHMTTAYRKVIWDSGNLENVTISDGSIDKSADCQLLVDWMNLSEHDVGLWVMGDDIAFDLNGLTSTVALDLLTNWCGVTLVHDSYYDLTGGRITGGMVTPLAMTVSNPFPNPLHPDSLYADAGCAIINAFDVLGKTIESEYALQYPDFQQQPYYAAIQNQTTNAAAYSVRTMWFGFSFMYIRDASITPSVAMVRNRIMEAIIDWMGNQVNDNITHDETPTAYKLTQNFPNPFNPSTTIMFDMRERGHVTLKIYNVAGQLVRTLVNGVKDAGHHKIGWDGRNNDGVSIASGVYFYKMETRRFSQTRKMVMLR